jgi:RNA polymerase sigma factor (sigma-70 family)
MTDNELIKAFIEKTDDIYFNQLYKRYETSVYQRCFRYVTNEDDVLDIVQNIWVIIYFHLKDFKYKSSFSTWLYRIIMNQCINFLKQKRNYYSIDDIQEQDIISAEIAEDALDKIVLSENVTNLFQKLSKEEMLLIKLKYIDELDYKSIEKITGLKNGSLRMRVNRIKEKLQGEVYEKR